MVTIKLDTPLLGLDKTPMKEPYKNNERVVTIGNVIASQFAVMSGLDAKDAIRVFRVADEMYEKESLDVDDEKLEFIQTMFEKCNLAALYKGQILQFLKSLKKE